MSVWIERNWPIILGYLALVNLADFVLMGMDKSRAKRSAWRVPERTFFVVALLGGSVGAVAGMQVFHHKTRHWYFKYGLPVILVLQVAIAAWVLIRT